MPATVRNIPMEKRKYKRVRNGHSALIRTEEGDSLTLDVMDYSLGGVCLVSNAPFEPGEQIELDSLLTLDGVTRPLGLKGRICHVTEQYQEFSFGVEFI